MKKYIHNIPERFTSVEEYLEYAKGKKAEELGYKEGDLFELTERSWVIDEDDHGNPTSGEIVMLTRDDRSTSPAFNYQDNATFYEGFECLIPVKEAVEEESTQVDTKVAEEVKQAVSSLQIGLNVSFDSPSLNEDFSNWIVRNRWVLFEQYLSEVNILDYVNVGGVVK